MNWIYVSWPLFVFGLAWPAWFAVRQAWRWRRRRSHCESCGYNLHARISDRCPECGHDVASRSRLIDARRMVLHTVIGLEMLVGSQLFYRIPAIQMRGWMAAVPTTVLIMCLSTDEPVRNSFSSPRLNRELAYRTEALGVAIEPWLQVDTDAAAHWQERWLIRKALRFEFHSDSASFYWQAPAVAMLTYASENDLLTPAQQSMLEHKCSAAVLTRRSWPLGAKVTADIEPRFFVFGEGIRLTARALTPGYSDVVLSMRIGDSLIDDWQPRERLLGVARQSGPVEYELLMERYHVASSSWEVMNRERRVVTSVSGSSEHGLEGRELPLDAIESLTPQLFVLDYSWQRATIRFHVGQSASFYEGLGETRFAVTVTLLRDGTPFTTGSGWWISPSQIHRRPFARYQVWNNLAGNATEQFLVPMEAPFETIWSSSDPPSNHEWSVVIEGDPWVALRDFDATTYWAGKHEFKNIPVEREERGK